jgi:acetyltransferase-like isoleucine patch superfamily enzyme
MGGRHIDEETLAQAFPEVSLGHGLQVLGLSHIAIGPGSCIGDGAWLNVCERSGGVRLRIGRNVLVGRHSMISTGGNLEIGDFNLFAPRVYISDADHVFEDIGMPYIEQGATLGRSVVVEENCWLGINVVVSGNLVLGRGSVIAANSVVVDAVPPFAVMAGAPARIVKLYNPRSRKWEPARSVPEQIRILEDRMAAPLPDREEYRDMLWRRSTLGRIDPVLAGAGRHLA